MFRKIHLSGRFSLLIHFIIWFVTVSLLLRLCFILWQYSEVSLNLFDVLRTLLTGLVFDIGAVTYITLPGIAYYALMPNRWVGSWADKGLVWFFTTLTVVILVFTFFAEVTFWEEFRTRFNFIAVDYLIYTHEVVSNINQSYPLPLLIGGVMVLTFGVLLVFIKGRRSLRPSPMALPSHSVVLCWRPVCFPP